MAVNFERTDSSNIVQKDFTLQNKEIVNISDFKTLLETLDSNNNSYLNSNISLISINFPFPDTYQLLIEKSHFDLFLTWLKKANVISLSFNNLPADNDFFQVLLNGIKEKTSIQHLTIQNTSLNFLNMTYFSKILSSCRLNKINLIGCKLGCITNEQFLEFVKELIKPGFITELDLISNQLYRIDAKTMDTFAAILAKSTIYKLEISDIKNSINKKLMEIVEINKKKRKERSEIIFTCHPYKSKTSKNAPFFTELYNNGLFNKIMPIIFEFNDCPLPKP